MWAKQSTAATIIVGPILDSTGAEYASAVIGDLSISKNGGTLTAMAAAATLTYIANGQYTLVTTAANLDTLGRFQVTCNKPTYQMPTINLMVVPAMVFDSIVLGTDDLDTNAKKWNDLTTVALPLVPTTAGRTLDVSAGGEAGLDWANIGSPTTANNLSATNIDVDQVVASVSGAVGSVTAAITLPTIPTGWITADGIAADAIGSSELAASAVAEIQSGLSTLAAADIRTAIGLASANLDTQIGALALAATALSTTQWTNTLATNLGTTNTSVAAIGATGTGLSAIPWNAAWDAEVQSEAQDAITASVLATAANLLIVSDGVGYLTSALLGTISDAGTAGETYVITFGGATYTLDYTGLDATGNRTGVTRTKT